MFFMCAGVCALELYIDISSICMRARAYIIYYILKFKLITSNDKFHIWLHAVHLRYNTHAVATPRVDRGSDRAHPRLVYPSFTVIYAPQLVRIGRAKTLNRVDVCAHDAYKCIFKTFFLVRWYLKVYCHIA